MAGLIALALAGVAVFLRAQLALTGNLWGVPLDDAYIHFRFVQNLATGHGFAFNPDQPVPGSTSPLWVLLLAVPTACGAPVWISAKVCGILFLIVSAVLAWRLAARYIAVPVAAWTVGALTALDGRLLWAAPSGMEVTLFTALSLAAFLARPARGSDRTTLKRRVLLVAALCGLATLARPEGYLLTAVLFGDLLVRVRPPIVAVLSALALYVALTAPYNVFALLTTGHPLPTTFYAKSVPLGPETLPHAIAYAAALAYLLAAGNVTLILAPLGAFALWRPVEATNVAVSTQIVCLRRRPLRSHRPFKVGSLPWSFRARPRTRALPWSFRARTAAHDAEARALVAWPLLLIAEQAVLSPVLYHFGRYVMPLQPFLLLWTVAGLARLTRVYAPTDKDKHGWSMTLVSSALAVVTVFSLGGWAQRYAMSVRDIDGMQVALGRWVRAHVPAGAPVAAHDIGAIGYISNHPIVDIEGLVTPRFLALKREQPEGRRAADIDAEIKRLGARYLIAFPRAYQSLTTQPGLTRVYSVTVRDPLIVQEATMSVYRVGSRESGVGSRESGVGSRKSEVEVSQKIRLWPTRLAATLTSDFRLPTSDFVQVQLGDWDVGRRADLDVARVAGVGGDGVADALEERGVVGAGGASRARRRVGRDEQVVTEHLGRLHRAERGAVGRGHDAAGGVDLLDRVGHGQGGDGGAVRAGRGESRLDEGGRHQGTRPVVDHDKVAQAKRRQTRLDRIGPLGAAFDHRVEGVPGWQFAALVDAPLALRRHDERDARQLGDGGQGAQGMLEQRPAREREPQLVYPGHAPAAAGRDDDGADYLGHHDQSRKSKVESRKLSWPGCWLRIVNEQRRRRITPYFRLPTSDFRLPTSDFRLSTFDFRLPTFDFRLSTFDFRLTPNA